MKKNDDSATKALVAIVMTVPNMLLSGWLLTYVWQWFAVGPLGAPPIGIADGLGIGALVGWFTAHFKRNDYSEDDALATFLRPLALTGFLFGYSAIIHAFQ